MKKFISGLLVLSMLFVLAACGGNPPATDNEGTTPPATTDNTGTTPPATTGDTGSTEPVEAFPGKIAVITNTVDQNEEEYRSAEQLVSKYGEDKIVHRTWPVNFMQEQEQMVTTVAKLGEDPDIKAIIINQGVMGSNPAIDKLYETRSDVFVVYCTPAENPPDVANRANLILQDDKVGMGPAMVKQAKLMGATKFAHYSFPRHMSMVLLAAQRDAIKATCEEEGLEFIPLTAPDPTSDVGIPGAQQYILEDVPKQISKLGENTAFYSTNCAMQIPLIAAVVSGHAIYPTPCDPSPFHGFPAALGIESTVKVNGEEKMRDINEVIEETKRIIAEKNMTGRVSTWAVPVSMMFTNAGAEYAIKWINGEVPKEGIDAAIVAQLCAQYAEEITGNKTEVNLNPYVEDGVTFNNYFMSLLGYMTY